MNSLTVARGVGDGIVPPRSGQDYYPLDRTVALRALVRSRPQAIGARKIGADGRALSAACVTLAPMATDNDAPAEISEADLEQWYRMHNGAGPGRRARGHRHPGRETRQSGG